jgi:multidrug efflux pump subunit AcrA (membrane-fusion protein)
MSARFQNTAISSPDVAWRQIEELIERTTIASQRAAEPSEFYRELLDGVVEALAANGGAVWLFHESCGEPQEFRLAVQRDFPPASADGAFELLNRQWVGEIAAAGEARAISPSAPIGSAANRAACLLLFCPVRVGARSVAVLELLQSPEMPAAARASALDVLESLAEAAADFHQAHELRVLRAQQDERDRLDAFSLAVQRSLDVPATAFTIANDGRALIGCDRVWVLAVRREVCLALAVSGCDHIDRGAESVRAMERLAAAVAVTAEPVWCLDDANDLAPAVESRLHEYLDKAHARQLAIVPISTTPNEDESGVAAETFAVIVVESFTEALPNDQLRRRLSAVCARSATALQHALSLVRIPGVTLLRRVGASRFFMRRSRASRWPWIAALLFVALAAPWFIPADFSVAGRGTLQPKVRRNLFAPRDAIVDKMLVTQGDAVAEGAVLIQLRASDLDYEQARLVGEVQAAGEQLRRVRAERVSGDAANAAGVPNGSRLAAEQELLEKRLAGLQSQQQLLQQQQATLRLTSPIAGEVLSWDLANRWNNRPVRQGERLVEIADMAGEWELELEVADRDVQHLLAAQQDLGENATVRYLLATDLQTTYKGRVDRVSTSAEHREGESPTVRVTVRVLDTERSALKAGASVVARIECGQRSLGYVWLHDAIDAVRQFLWW